MMVLTYWVPPKIDYVRDQNVPYLYCTHCSVTIEQATIIGIDSYDIHRLALLPNESTPRVKCTACAFKELLHFTVVRDTINEMVREELKKIIKEEVHDPNGAFSPEDGCQQT